MENSIQVSSQNPYLASLVMSSSPAQLVALLYDGLIRFLNAAQDGFLEENPQKRNETIHNNLIKAQNILNELDSTLDREQGGEFVNQMADLYQFYNYTLRRINSTKDPRALPKVIQLITELRDAWYQTATAGVESNQFPTPLASGE